MFGYALWKQTKLFLATTQAMQKKKKKSSVSLPLKNFPFLTRSVHAMGVNCQGNRNLLRSMVYLTGASPAQNFPDPSFYPSLEVCNNFL